MHTRRITTILWSLVVVCGMALILTPCALAGDTRLIVVPPFKGNVQYAPLLTALQHMLIDDLHAILDQQVMTREEMLAFLKTVGQKPRKHLYISDISQFSSALNTRFVLINELVENAGICTWQVKLIQGNTAVLDKIWQFEGNLEHLFSMQQQVVAVVRQALLEASKQGESRPGTAEIRGEISTLMAFAHGLEAHDRRDYDATVKHWRQALQHEAAFHYATTQLAQLRTTVQRAGLSPRQMGLFLQADGQYEQAESFLQKALRQNSRDREVLLALSDMALAQKNYPLARQHATKARDGESKQAQPWMILGKIAQAEGNPREAYQMFQKAQELAPASAEPRHALAETAANLGEQDKAKAAYAQAAELYTAELRVEAAQDAIQKAQYLAPRDTAHFIAAGNLARRMGRQQDALQAYQQAQAIEPKNATTSQQIASVYKQLGQTQLAVQHYQQALSMSADHFEANFELGQLYVETGQSSHAVPHLEKARALRPRRTEVKATLAKAYSVLGKQDAVLQEYRSLLQEGDQDADMYKAYGDALLDTGQVVQAEQQYAKAVRINPDLAAAYVRLGEVYQKLGKTPKATTALAQAQLLQTESTSAKPEPAIVPQDITAFVASFPQVRGASITEQVAVIDLTVFVEKSNIFRKPWTQVRKFLRVRKPNLERIGSDLEGALQQRYHTIPLPSIQQKFLAIPYNSMQVEHLSSKQYLADLCTHLGVEALIFYKILSNGIIDNNAYAIVIRQLMYEKLRNSLWSNELTLKYPKENIEEINRPYLITLATVASLLLVYICIYLIKGFGRLHISIKQDDHREKTYFSVVLSKNSNKNLAKTRNILLKKVKKHTTTKEYKSYTRFYHWRKRYLILAETLFKRVHVGTYHVYIVGVMKDVIGDEIGNYQMMQSIHIKRRHKHELVFDLRKQASRIHIQVLCGQEFARGAEISLKGQNESRYIKDETGALFQLPMGRHTFLVHYDNKLFTEEIEIRSLQKNHKFTFKLPVNG